MRLNVTPDGVDLLLHCLEGGPSPVFTEIVLGNGGNAGENAAELSNPIKTFGISRIEREEGSEYVTLYGSFNNADIAERFRATETGIRAEDPDDDRESILFAYGYVPSDEAPVIPAAADYTFETTDKFIVYVGKTENVTAIIAEGMNTVSRVEFEAHVNNFDNPHHVDKRHLGLENVVNKSPEDTVVLFDEEENDDPITPGDTTATVFQKVASWLQMLVTHITNYKNPHKLNADTIGAAAKSHGHSATDITAGILPVARGGTGVSSMASLLNSLRNQGAAKFTVGSYVGTGSYGSANPNIFTFASAPKVIIVQPVTPASGVQEGFIAINGVSTLYTGGINNDVACQSSVLYFTWSGSIVKWYGSSDAGRQCNVSGKTYKVFAIL